jgi:hypothetical protein
MARVRRYLRSALRAWIWIALVAPPAGAQVNQNVWVASSNAVYEVTPAGALVGMYGAACLGAISPCQFRTARDQFGNVYVAALTYFAPGIGGSIRRFQSGGGVTTLFSGGFSGISVDAAGHLWWAALNYSSSAMTVVSSTVFRGATPSAGPDAVLSLQGTFTLLEPHPDSGVWASDGVMLHRLRPGAGGGIVSSASISLPGLTALAADGLGRVWAHQQSTSQLIRVVENAAGLAVDLTHSVPGLETVLVDRLNQVFAHVITPNNLSALVRFGADGTPLPTTNYPVRLRTIDVDTHGGLWGQHLAFTSGIGLLYQDAAGVIGATVLNPAAPSLYEAFTTHGDTTGSIFARLGPPGLDSDGDGSPNRVEVVRGTDPFDPSSLPPTVTITPLPGPGVAFAIGYLDADPAHSGFGYALGCALSAGVGIAAGPHGANPTVPLDLDFLLLASLTAGPPTFVNFGGPIPPSGSATGLITLPPGTPSGVTVFFAGATLTPAGVCVASSDASSLTTP